MDVHRAIIAVKQRPACSIQGEVDPGLFAHVWKKEAKGIPQSSQTSHILGKGPPANRVLGLLRHTDPIRCE